MSRAKSTFDGSAAESWRALNQGTTATSTASTSRAAFGDTNGLVSTNLAPGMLETASSPQPSPPEEEREKTAASLRLGSSKREIVRGTFASARPRAASARQEGGEGIPATAS